MGKKGKSIDGLSGGARPPKVNAKPKVAPSKNGVSGVIPSKTTTKSTSSATKSQRPRSTRRNSKIDDFLKPVKSYDFDFNSEDLKKDRHKKRNPKGKKKKGWKNWSKKRKVLTIIGTILVAVIIALIIWLNIIIGKMTNGQSNIWDSLWSDGVDLKRDSNNRTNIILFGTGGYDMEGTEGDYEHDGAQLTDSIMVISLDQDTKDVAMLNIPRDLKVSEACSAGKINEVYWCNNQDGQHEIEGAQALITSVDKVLGIDIQYYAHLDWTSLIQIVDVIGGITVTLDEDVADDWTQTYIEAGVPTTLNGDQALGLARARHGTTGGDFTRGNSQQKIMISIEQKILEKGLGLSDAWNLLNILGDNLRSNFKTDEIKRVVKIFKDFDLNNMRQIPLTNTSDNVDYVVSATISGISYVVPSAGIEKYDDIQKYISKMFSSDPAKRENANIMVLNGSTTTGVASAEKDKLNNIDLKVGYIGDAPSTEYSGITIYAVNDTKPGTKSLLESTYGVKVQSADSIPKGIITDGYDFLIIVGNQNNSTTTTH